APRKFRMSRSRPAAIATAEPLSHSLEQPKGITMEYTRLGRTGLKVSRLCLGCMTFGREIDEAASLPIIQRALDEGVNFFDTANVYGNGASEAIVGKALKGHRQSIVLASK